MQNDIQKNLINNLFTSINNEINKLETIIEEINDHLKPVLVFTEEKEPMGTSLASMSPLALKLHSIKAKIEGCKNSLERLDSRIEL